MKKEKENIKKEKMNENRKENGFSHLLNSTKIMIIYYFLKIKIFNFQDFFSISFPYKGIFLKKCGNLEEHSFQKIINLQKIINFQKS